MPCQSDQITVVMNFAPGLTVMASTEQSAQQSVQVHNQPENLIVFNSAASDCFDLQSLICEVLDLCQAAHKNFYAQPGWLPQCTFVTH